MHVHDLLYSMDVKLFVCFGFGRQTVRFLSDNALQDVEKLGPNRTGDVIVLPLGLGSHIWGHSQIALRWNEPGHVPTCLVTW